MRRLTSEYYALALASLVVLAFQVLIPNLSVEYGVLRAFQQSLLVLAPFLAVASALLFRRLGRAADYAVASLALAILVSTSGLLPQSTGGYPPQLNLDNEGTYYDIYYVHPEEVAGIKWVRSASNGSDVQSEVQTDRYTFNRLQTFTGASTLDDIFPSLIRLDAFVFLGFSTVRNDTSTVAFEGDLITYRYPVSFLSGVKSLVYSNGGTEIFR
jgi:uncharacterized membrane protein